MPTPALLFLGWQFQHSRHPMRAHKIHPASHPIFQLQHCIQLPTSLASRWGRREPEHPRRQSPSTHSWAWNQRAGEVTQSPCSSLAPQSQHWSSCPAHNRVVIKHQVTETSSVTFCVCWLLINAIESAALEGGDQPCSAQTQQAQYCDSIHLHWYNLAADYSEGMLTPDGAVFTEPGCFYGVMDLGLSFLSTSHWARKALEYSSTQVYEA